jgi:hypothetical protein
MELFHVRAAGPPSAFASLRARDEAKPMLAFVHNTAKNCHADGAIYKLHSLTRVREPVHTAMH